MKFGVSKSSYANAHLEYADDELNSSLIQTSLHNFNSIHARNNDTKSDVKILPRAHWVSPHHAPVVQPSSVPLKSTQDDVSFFTGINDGTSGQFLHYNKGFLCNKQKSSDQLFIISTMDDIIATQAAQERYFEKFPHTHNIEQNTGVLMPGVVVAMERCQQSDINLDLVSNVFGLYNTPIGLLPMLQSLAHLQSVALIVNDAAETRGDAKQQAYNSSPISVFMREKYAQSLGGKDTAGVGSTGCGSHGVLPRAGLKKGPQVYPGLTAWQTMEDTVHALLDFLMLADPAPPVSLTFPRLGCSVRFLSPESVAGSGYSRAEVLRSAGGGGCSEQVIDAPNPALSVHWVHLSVSDLFGTLRSDIVPLSLRGAHCTSSIGPAVDCFISAIDSVATNDVTSQKGLILFISASGDSLDTPLDPAVANTLRGAEHWCRTGTGFSAMYFPSNAVGAPFSVSEKTKKEKEMDAVAFRLSHLLLQLAQRRPSPERTPICFVHCSGPRVLPLQDVSVGCTY
jgi:hypothetical protein